MPATVVVGVQWGDEAKGKVVDILSESADVMAKFNGGNNAGANLDNGLIQIVTKCIPPGIFGNCDLYIGSNCVVPYTLIDEIQEIEVHGLSVRNRLNVSARATLVQPHHLLEDGINGKGIGSTGKGIGPAYGSQAQRMIGKKLQNVQLGAYLNNPEKMFDVVRTNLHDSMDIYSITNTEHEVKFTNLLDEFHKSIIQLEDVLCDNPFYLHEFAEEGKEILMVGSNGLDLDPVHGTTPHTTSSRTLPGAAYLGDLPVKYHKKIIGVAKAILTRVGHGPMIGEFAPDRQESYTMEDGGHTHKRDWEEANYNLQDLLKSGDEHDLSIAIRLMTNQYGARTKRPRRIAPLNTQRLGEVCRINGIDEVVLNMVDAWHLYSKTTLPGIPIVTGCKIDGIARKWTPTTNEGRYSAEGVREYLPHTPDISYCRIQDDLPGVVIDNLKRVQEEIGVPITYIGINPTNEGLIKVDL
jgi:adenylosuccinate synthase